MKEIKRLSKVEARTLSRFGHMIIAGLDDALCITGYYLADDLHLERVKAGRGPRQKKQAPFVRQEDELQLIKNMQPHFSNPRAFVARGYRFIKVELKDGRKMKRAALEKVLMKKLTMNRTQVGNIITHLLHSYKAIEPVKKQEKGR
ncbi:hypothetical protein KAR91_02550 [Candidatus Pacearchaeota archaeon]|nr:hypothetical protein [Candidatus Pacearchaeota archaeon]